MKIEKILFPTKFRELSFNSLESLFVLKDAGLKEVVLCYIIPRDEVGFVPFGGYLKDEEERLRAEARVRFEDWQKAIAERGIASKIIIEVGDPVPKILRIAEEEKVDLIIVGKKKGTFFESSFVGTNTLKVITRSKVPTLASKYMVEFERDGEHMTCVNREKFIRPLLPTDWSESSERALKLLISLNGIVQKACVCHVIDSKELKAVGKEAFGRIEDENKRKLEHYCDMLQQSGIAAEFHIGAGDVTEEIVRISRQVEASIIIMGTTGKDRLHEIFLGSSSHKIAQISELPTLLVP